jgi:hypothetical protein
MVQERSSPSLVWAACPEATFSRKPMAPYAVPKAIRSIHRNDGLNATGRCVWSMPPELLIAVPGLMPRTLPGVRSQNGAATSGERSSAAASPRRASAYAHCGRSGDQASSVGRLEPSRSSTSLCYPHAPSTGADPPSRTTPTCSASPCWTAFACTASPLAAFLGATADSQRRPIQRCLRGDYRVWGPGRLCSLDWTGGGLRLHRRMGRRFSRERMASPSGACCPRIPYGRRSFPL